MEFQIKPLWKLRLEEPVSYLVNEEGPEKKKEFFSSCLVWKQLNAHTCFPNHNMSD